jgi:hypothetical protein
LKWWRKDKTLAPVDYTGGRNAEGIVNWIKENTEHPWVALKGEEEGQKEEQEAEETAAQEGEQAKD